MCVEAASSGNKNKGIYMRTTRFGIGIVLLAFVVCATAQAVPFELEAEWMFSTDDTICSPDTNIDAATASATVQVGAFGSGWTDSLPAVYGSAQGFWDIGLGGISIDMPCTLDAQKYADIWVGVVYWDDISAMPSVLVQGGELVEMSAPLPIEAGPAGGGWYATMSHWTIDSSPESFTIDIMADQNWGSVIDGVFVDVSVVPEPATIVLLAMGGIALAIRRRRR